MPKLKESEKIIPSFYRQKTLDIMLFATVYLLCYSGKFGKIKIKEAVELFQEIFEINEEDFPIDSALVQYALMKEKFLWRKLKEMRKRKI